MNWIAPAFISVSLLAQAQAPADGRQPATCWTMLWSRVPELLKTKLATTPLVTNGRPPMEILTRPLVRKAPPGGDLTAGPGGMEPTSKASAPPPEPLLEPKNLYSWKAIEVYSKMQAKTLGDGLVSPRGAALTFDQLVPGKHLTRTGSLEEKDDGGTLYFTDPKGTRWPLRFDVVGPAPARDWLIESAFSEETRKLQGFILAGEWPKAMEVNLRKAARKTSPNEPLLFALDILAALDQPAGKEEQLLEAAARLAALMPRNPDTLSLSAAAYLAAGKPEFAGRIKSWLTWVKPVTP